MKKKASGKILQIFKDLYKSTTGETYLPLWGRDGALFKGLVSELGEDRVIDCLFLYFEKPRKSYNPVFFRTDINDLLLQYKRENPVKEKLSVNDRYSLLDTAINPEEYEHTS